jgi:hypothetical protein
MIAEKQTITINVLDHETPTSLPSELAPSALNMIIAPSRRTIPKKS